MTPAMTPAITHEMTQEQKLLDVLRQFASVAKPHRPFAREGVGAWTFTHNQVEHLLHFHATPGKAAVEFAALMRLQDLKLPAPRAIALLSGFAIDSRKGDAVILTRLAAATRLDEIDPTTLSPADRQRITHQMIDLLKQCHTHRCCPLPLTLGRFALWDQQVILVPDAHAPGGFVNADRLGELAASAVFVSTRSERLRFWNALRPGDSVPAESRLFPASPAIDSGKPVDLDGRFGLIRERPLHGCWWSKLAASPISTADVRTIATMLTDVSQGTPIKSDPSGQVRELTHGGHTLIVKTPQPKPGLKRIIARFRQSRVRRVWDKTHRLLDRGFAVEMPVLFVESDESPTQLIVFDKVPGTVLSRFDLDSVPAPQRELLMRRLGTFVRRIEAQRWSHFDTKTTNWIIATDRSGDPSPVMIDCDGVRFYPWRGFAFKRLLRALDQHPQFSTADRLALRAGYLHNLMSKSSRPTHV